MKKLFLLFFVATFACYSVEAKNPKSEKINNIIYMIGDGMGLSHVSMLQLENKYAPTAFDRAQKVALIKTHSLNIRVTDSAAAGTALAAGYKTNNSTVGQLPDGTPVESITTKAKRNNFATGIVVSCYVQHATPATFFAHRKSRGDNDGICEDFTKEDLDVVFGGGMRYFKQYFEKQNKDCNKEFEALGYSLHTDLSKLNDIPAEGKVLGLFADGDLPSAKSGKRGEYLADATQKALDILTNNVKKNKNKGFVLMVEGSKIDGESHSRSPEGILAETRDFANAINVAMDYADTHPGTLVVVAADHETGGLSLPSGKSDFTLSESGIDYRFGTNSHSAIRVPAFFYGAGADRFGGMIDNTELAKQIMQVLNLAE